MTPGSVNNLPITALFPASARGSALSETGAGTGAQKSVEDRVESSANSSANIRNDSFSPERAAGIDSSQRAGAETAKRVVSRSQLVEPVLEMDDLPATTRNALNTYISAQQALDQNAPATVDRRQSIVGVDLFV